MSGGIVQLRAGGGVFHSSFQQRRIIVLIVSEPVPIGEPKHGRSEQDAELIGQPFGEEINATLTTCGDIGADIEELMRGNGLEQKRTTKSGPHVAHGEGHATDVGHAVVEIERERHKGLQVLGLNGKVQEHRIPPAGEQPGLAEVIQQTVLGFNAQGAGGGGVRFH